MYCSVIDPATFIVQIKDALYTLNERNILVFKNFTEKKLVKSVNCAPLVLNFLDDGTVEQGPNISLDYKKIDSVVFNGIKAEVGKLKSSEKQLCIFNP